MSSCDYLCAIARVLYSVFAMKVVASQVFADLSAMVHCVPLFVASEGVHHINQLGRNHADNGNCFCDDRGGWNRAESGERRNELHGDL